MGKKEERNMDVKLLKKLDVDRFGNKIPESIVDGWVRAIDFAAVLATMIECRTMIESGIKNNDVILREISCSTLSVIKQACIELKCVIPYTVCPTCQGRKPDRCSLCRGRGYISEYRYKNCVPDKVRELHEKRNSKNQ